MQRTKAALQRLSPADRKDVQRVRDNLAQVQGDESYPFRVVAELGRLFPGYAASLYERDQRGEVCSAVHTFTGSGQPSTRWLRVFDDIPRIALYPVRGTDPWAQVPVETATLYRDRPQALDHFRELMADVDAWYQLRVTLYDGPRFLAHCGVFATARQAEFDVRARDRLAAIVPALADGVAIWQRVGHQPVSGGEVEAIMDAFAEPALLTTPEGRAVFANAAARARWARGFPPWILELARSARDDDRPDARIKTLEVDGRTLRLVVSRSACHDGPSRMPDGLTQLPSALQPVARLAATGLPTKEVAARTSLSVATVRTYLQRIYRHLGVSGRIELAHRLHMNV